MEVLVLAPDFDAVTVLDVFDSLIWTERYYGYGDFELYTPTNQEITNLIKQDSYLWMKDSEIQMIVEKVQIESDVEEGDRTTVTGRSLSSILDRRIIWARTVLTGNLQNGILKLLNENAINPTDPARKIPNLEFLASTDPKVTDLTIDAQIFGKGLYETIQAICEANGIGFKIVLTPDERFVFSLYAGTDRSYSQIENPYVVFSPDFDNLINSNYIESKEKYKTVTLVGGEGEGAAQKTISVSIQGGGGTGLARREIFTDAAGVSSNVDGGTLSPAEYNAQLSQKGEEFLAENSLIVSFEGKVEGSRTFKYGVDFTMGDIVQVANEYGIESRSRVIELIRSQDTSGIETYPTFGIA